MVRPRRYSVGCDKSPERGKCGCGSPGPRNSSSPASSVEQEMGLRESRPPQEAEMDLTIKGPNPSRMSRITSLYHHHHLPGNDPRQQNPSSPGTPINRGSIHDEPLDVTLNANRNNNWTNFHIFFLVRLHTKETNTLYNNDNSKRWRLLRENQGDYTVRAGEW